MLTPENAQTLADAVIQEARRQADEAREKHARGVSFAYRVAGISQFSKWQQEELLREATARSKSSTITRLTTAAWVVVCLSTLYLLRSQLGFGIALFFCFSMIGTSFIMWLSIRSHLRSLLEEQIATKRDGAA